MIVNVSRTSDVGPRHQFDYWRDAISSTIAPLDAVAAPRPGFRGQLRWAAAGAAHLVDVVADAHRVERNQRLIDRSPSGCYKVSVQLLGRAVLNQGRRTAHLEPGDIAVYDPDRPYSLTFDTAHHMLVVMCPKQLLRLEPREVDALLACRMSGRESIGALVFAFMSELALQFDCLPTMNGARLGDSVADLLTSLLLEQMPASRLAVSRRSLLTQVTNYIEQHLSDPQLCPEQIADAHGYSTRALHKLFHDGGMTVAGWIRQRRLEQCRRDLRDPARNGIPVGVIGSRWGFDDPAHFSRVFKAAYGVSPRAFRWGWEGAEPEAVPLAVMDA